MGQGISIYIDDKNKFDASAAANSFADNDVKNRAYMNVLGAELTTKYLNSEHIEVPNNFNIHSVKKVLEEFDISDVMLKGLHIDVRVIFDENVIFIPKTHFDYNLTPDVYVVLKFVKDSVNAEFLGFFEPQLINTNNANKDYYFIEKEKLSAPENFTEYVKANNKSIGTGLSDETMDESERIIISFIDNDITDADKKTLLKNLTKSAELREKFIEYENFETLSFQAMFEPTVEKGEIVQDALVQDEFDVFDKPVEQDNSENSELETEPVENIEPLETVESVENTEVTEPLDTVEPIENVEVNEPLDTVESVENIDITEPLDIEPIETEENIVFSKGSEPFENIDVTEPVDIEPIETEENIELSEDIEPVESIDVIDENLYQTDNIEVVEDVNIQENLPEDGLSFDDIEEFKAEPVAQVVEETVPMEDLENGISEQSNDESSEDMSDIQNIENVSVEDIDTTPESVDVISNEDSQDSTAFGKNLIENLTYEEDESVADETQPEIYNEVQDVEPDTQETAVVYDDTVVENDVDNSSDVPSEQDKLNVLYSEENTQQEIEFVDEDGLNNFENPEPDNAAKNMNIFQNYKKQILAAILFLAIVSVGYFTLLKPKASPDFTAQNEVSDNVAETQTKTDNMTEENILATNAPEVPETKTVEVTNPKPVQELKNTAKQPKPKTAISYMDVSKIVWDVPDSMSKNPDIQNYLRTAGKSIKVSLSADLLLATEYAYSNFVKVGLNIGQTGNIISSKILTSSGSTEIDNIVLQSVKDTLNTVKPRSGAVQSPNFNLSIIIYF